MWIETLLIILILYIIWNLEKKPSNYPPGPWGVPVFGYIPFGEKNFENKLQELNKKHGDIVSWRIGSKVLIFLFDFKIIKEAMQSQTFADRPNVFFLSVLLGEYNKGVISSNGLHWLNMRRFALRHLRDLGMGKSKIVSVVQFEAMEVVKVMKKQAGKSALLPHAISPAVINILWQMVASKRYELNDKGIFEIDELLNDMQNSMSRLLIEDFFPWLKSLFPEFIWNAITNKSVREKLSDKMIKKFELYINEHIETLDPDNSRDFIDDYLIEMENQKSDPDSTMSLIGLTACIADLFGAGLETTTSTIYWAIFLLAKYPKIQARLQREIDDMLPNGMSPTLDDKSRLPFTEAFISEVLRYSSMAGLGAPHSNAIDTTLGGFTIPKNAMIFQAINSVHYDPSMFESPKEFRPQRFLNSDGKFQTPKSGFLPFGIGKRQCLGEQLARLELFIFLTIMIQHLQFNVPPNKEIDLNPEPNPLFRFPKRQQEILITNRY